MTSERDVEHKIKNIFQNIPEFKDTRSDVPVDSKRADLVIFRDNKPFMVIEVKKEITDPTDIDVVSQASFYALTLGSEYFGTTNGKYFVLFETFRPGTSLMDRKLKYFEVDEFLPKKVLGEITHGVQWMRFDDAFVHKLQILHEAMTSFMLRSLEKSLVDKKFMEEYQKWITGQGFEYETITEKHETNRIISNQATYLLINKIFFYKILETVYPQIPRLRSIDTLDISSYLEEYFKVVLKIDYRAVFQQGLFDRIKIPHEVASTLVKFIKELELFDFEKIENDVIGRIYEKLIPIGQRKKLGQYYTPPQIVELILKLTIKDSKQKIMDPACGSGGFLVGGYKHLLNLKDKTRATTENEHQSLLNQIVGVEINQFPAHLSVINLAMQGIRFRTNNINVLVSDFFDLKPFDEWWQKEYKKAHLDKKEETTKTYRFFDCVVANPPYIRQEIITQKKKLQDIMKFESASIGKTSDIYSYFFVHATQFLKNEGRLGFITSNKWLEVKYGESLQKFFLNNHKILYVIEFDAAAFEEVDVNTCVTILQKEKDSKKRVGNRVKFVRVKKPIKIEKLVQILEKTDKDFEDDNIRIIVVPQFKLEKEDKWSVCLRAPRIYHKIIKNENFTEMSNLCEINRGFTSGVNEFFYLSEDDVKGYGVEKEFLKPLIKTPRDLSLIELSKNPQKNFVLKVSLPKDKLVGKNVLKYINTGEEHKYHLRATVKNRKLWYDLGDKKPKSILFARKIWENIVLAINDAEAFADQPFYEIEPKNKNDIYIISAFLSSSISKLFYEIKGRSYGGGVLELAIYEAINFPILNPTKITKSYKQNLENKFKELLKIPFSDKKKFEEKIKELDDIIFDILNLSKDERKQVYDALKEALNLRIKRKEKKVLVG